MTKFAGVGAALVTVSMVVVGFWASTVLAIGIIEVPNPRSQMAWVSDLIDVLPASMEAEINAKLSALQKETGIEIALVTVESVDAPTPKDFATELFNVWGIGKRENSSGLLILLVHGDHRVEVETGYGLESVLTDGWVKRMQVVEMLPYFKDGRYDLGLEAGVDAVLKRLGKDPQEIAAMEAIGDFGYEGAIDFDEEEDGNWFLYFLGLGVGGLGLGYSRKVYLYRRARACDVCKKQMEMVWDGEEEKFLQAGEILEQQLKSVDYQFYHCKGCNYERRLVVDSWLSGYSKCDECGYKTVESTSVIVSHSTLFSTGLKEVTEDCKFCDYHLVREETIPMDIEMSSDSDDESDGDFSGGSSGGGGAGSSW